MTYDITTKALWDSRRGFLGWALGLAGATAVYTGSYGLMEPQEYSDLIASMPSELIDAFGWGAITTPSGYLGSTVFGLVIPILTTVFAIGLGARLLAGDEESGRLEMTVTLPVSRVSLLVQRAAAAALACLGMAGVVFLTTALLLHPVGLDVPVGNVLAASLQLGILGVVFATFTLTAGAFVGRRGLVIGVASAVAVAAYFGNTIIPTLEGLAWVETISFFHYYDGATALAEGFAVGNSIVLLALSLAFLGAGVLGFDRRDIGT